MLRMMAHTVYVSSTHVARIFTQLWESGDNAIDATPNANIGGMRPSVPNGLTPC